MPVLHRKTRRAAKKAGATDKEIAEAVFVAAALREEGLLSFDDRHGRA